MGLKKGIKITVGITLVIILCVGAYYYFHPKNALKLILPDFTGENHIRAKVTNDTAYVSLESYLKNTALYDVSIDSISYSIYLDTALIIDEHKRLNFSQKTQQTDTSLLEFEVPLKKLINTIDNLQSKDSTFIKAKFNIFYNTLFGRFSIDFSKKKKINAPVPPKIEILEVNKKNIDLLEGKADLEIQLKIINQSTLLDLDLSNLSYYMVIGGESIVLGAKENSIVIDPKSSTIITVPVKLDINSPLKTLWNVFIDGEKKDFYMVIRAMLSYNNIAKLPIEIIVNSNIPPI